MNFEQIESVWRLRLRPMNRMRSGFTGPPPPDPGSPPKRQQLRSSLGIRDVWKIWILNQRSTRTKHGNFAVDSITFNTVSASTKNPRIASSVAMSE
jgi:hypothetical protein